MEFAVKITRHPRRVMRYALRTALPYVQGAGSVLDLRGFEGQTTFVAPGDFQDDFDNLSRDTRDTDCLRAEDSPV